MKLTPMNLTLMQPTLRPDYPQIKSLALGFIWLLCTASFCEAKTLDAPLPEQGSAVHNGVATCATSACHGKIAAVPERNVQLNEYHLWSTQDRHSRAYQTLLSDKSKSIANKLNLPSAHTASQCLACHADNVQSAKRGAKFQLSDGVGCEACHGGSEQWLKTHTEPNATHANNISAGLYPSENPAKRAQLCLSCHVGTQNKFADHQMMAAGHPRLTFEMDTFNANQPAHYTVDSDYLSRKGAQPLGQLWVAGQLENAKSLLTLIANHGGIFTSANLAIYDCHGCHKPMKTSGLKSNDMSAGHLPLGSPRLLDYSFDMLRVLFAQTLPTELPNWQNAIANLHAASANPVQLKTTTAKASALVAQLEQNLSAKPLDPNALRSLRRALAEQGSNGGADDFTSAEQTFLAIETLSYSLNDRDKLLSLLDDVYKSVDNEFTFNPTTFRQALAKLKQKL